MPARLHLIVEGQTEEGFVKHVLREYLAAKGIWVDVCLVQTGPTRSRRHKGGGRSYLAWRRDILTRIAEDGAADSYVTTMVDLYGMVALRGPFPGSEETRGERDPYARVAAVIGLDVLRERCRHFGGWLDRLEGLAHIA